MSQHDDGHWLIGRFDAKCCLAHVETCGHDFGLSATFNVMFCERQSGVVRLNITEAKTAEYNYAIAESLESGRKVRAAVLRHRSKGPISPEAARATLHRCGVTLGSQGRITPAQVARRRKCCCLATIVLNRTLAISKSWYADETEFLRAEDSGTLPAFIALPLAAYLASWDWRFPESCPSQTFTIAPDLLVRAVPLVSGDAVEALMTVETIGRRCALENAVRDYHISTREIQVLRMALQGNRNAEIAKQLGIVEATVQEHIKSVIGKTGARNRVEMTARLLGFVGHDLADQPETVC